MDDWIKKIVRLNLWFEKIEQQNMKFSNKLNKMAWITFTTGKISHIFILLPAVTFLLDFTTRR